MSRPKLTNEEIQKLKRDADLEDLSDDNEFVQDIVDSREDSLFNANEPVDSAEVGERLWMAWPTGQMVQCTVLEEEEDCPPRYYKVHPDGNESDVSMAAANLYKTPRACMLGNMISRLREYAMFMFGIRCSFTGIDGFPEHDKYGQPAKYKVGDTVWFREPNNDVRYHSGVVTAVIKEDDPDDAEFMPYTYRIRSVHETRPNLVFVRELASDDVFGSRNEVIIDIIDDREMCTVMGDPMWYASLRGLTETIEDVPDDYKAESL